MKRILAGAAAVAAIAVSASGASAFPLAGAGQTGHGFNSGIIQVHGVHRECVEGRFGWHRSTPWGGRIVCSPPWRKWRHGHGYGHNEFRDRDRGHNDRYVAPEPRRPIDTTPHRRTPRGSY